MSTALGKITNIETIKNLRKVLVRTSYTPLVDVTGSHVLYEGWTILVFGYFFLHLLRAGKAISALGDKIKDKYCNKKASSALSDGHHRKFSISVIPCEINNGNQ